MATSPHPALGGQRIIRLRAPRAAVDTAAAHSEYSGYSDADDAALYDVLNPWDSGRSPGDRFCHELVMAAGSVLDVGCGTGAMLACARRPG